MKIPDIIEKTLNRINEVTIGATKEQGGTRRKTVTIGGESALPFLTFEGEIPNKPVIAGYVTDDVSDLPDVLKDAVGKEIYSPCEWASKYVNEMGVDLISLKLIGADPTRNNTSPTDCANLVMDILKAVDVPLIIWGCGDDAKDSLVLPECSNAAKGENCLIGSAKETNYKTLVAICKADNHKLIAEAPVDINLGKQINILLQDSEFDLKDVVMFQATAALGYGLEYVYTILERARTTGLKGDKILALPQICDIAGETWRVKEAISDEDILPDYGKLKKRAPLWEAVCANVYLQAGAEILIMSHPVAIKSIQETINRFLLSVDKKVTL